MSGSSYGNQLQNGNLSHYSKLKWFQRSGKWWNISNLCRGRSPCSSRLWKYSRCTNSPPPWSTAGKPYYQCSKPDKSSCIFCFPFQSWNGNSRWDRIIQGLKFGCSERCGNRSHHCHIPKNSQNKSSSCLKNKFRKWLKRNRSSLQCQSRNQKVYCQRDNRWSSWNANNGQFSYHSENRICRGLYYWYDF